MHQPTFREERALYARGYTCVIGIDEVGCGALAGPVVAGAVMLPTTSRLREIHDSKKLSETKRERLFEIIQEREYPWATGEASVEEIGEFGLRQATFLAMHRAAEGIPSADFALVDAWTIPHLPIRQKGIIKGDCQVKSIAAASIVAKVVRDRQMKEYAEKYPEYSFEKHKGYGTKAHRLAIEKYGPCTIHRTSYSIFP